MSPQQLRPARPSTVPDAIWSSDAVPPDLFTPGGGTVEEFAATARLLHPASDTDGQPVTWAQVAARTGHGLHPHSTWDEVSGAVHTRRSTRSGWPGGAPELGELGEPGWDALLSHLTLWSGSGSGAACLLAVAEDLPWVRGGAHVGFYGDPHHTGPPQEPAFTAEVLTAAPRVQLLRTCLLLAGPLAAVRTLGRTWRYQDRHWFERHGPTALWPVERSWLVLTDLDADCTVVAGPRALIDAVRADDRLEARPQAAS
ncbi:hypothetical protein MO973_38040 [Paenibacillus sp. TRM 82003]|uniref:hypothetical protein n=1 Tax=Kineococcus sp. TRM81007 TaxID=2925831 RepID=UPI001F5A4B6C|nr:hypothetical protein [Kineococcus sp. TRM81007]MCI2237992.1 hypothetical protein [Kineococcus sp. TRM81007]MCI3926006.1 hypothetical protein [Paenibacillus sp. TRM 82003]